MCAQQTDTIEPLTTPADQPPVSLDNVSEEETNAEDAFAQLFADGSLPVPLLPSACLPALQAIEPWLFATSEEIERPDFFSLESLEELADMGKDATGLDDPNAFLLCGVSGYGVNNWHFHYVYAHSRLCMGITLPYGNAYPHAGLRKQGMENDGETENLTAARDLLEFCLRSTRGGQSYGVYENARLMWGICTIKGQQCVLFRLSDSDGKVLLEGEGVDGLLDFLQSCVDSGENASSPQWLRI